MWNQVEPARGTASTSSMTTMEPGPQRSHRGAHANGHVDGGRRTHHGNKRWVADGVIGRSGASTPHPGSDSERWERGGHRGGGRARGRGGRGKFGNTSVTFRRNGALDGGATGSEGEHSEMEEEHEVDEADSNEPETPEERENFWQELVKAREAERKKAIAEGKMDDPLKPKRLEDAITMVGTCTDMCPRFERYRRERENNLFEWETIPGTKRVDHKRAVKAYERAAGDKTLPSDLRPPEVLKRTLDYLFHELLPHGGFSETFNFIRDRSRSVRNDFTMQHEMGPIAIECHGRCARFHILALHVERDRRGFSIAMEEQQLMNTLQSLKEFYHDQRGHYQSPSELEMRVYHRLVHIRDQRERHDDIPQALLNHPVFELTTKFRARIQAKSAPITKTSPLSVDAEAMNIFAELAGVLRREGNVVMTYLVACILERHFGKGTIEDIESIRGDLSFSDIIDGYIGTGSQEHDTDIDISVVDETEDQAEPPPAHTLHESPIPLQPSGTQWLTDTFGSKPTQSAFFKPGTTDPHSQPSAAPPQSAFSNLKTVPNAFGTAAFGTQSAFTNAGSTAPLISVFGTINHNIASAPSSLPHRVTEASSTPAGFTASSSVSSFPPFVPTPARAEFTTFTPQAGQPPQTSAFPSPQPQVNGFTIGPAKKSTFLSEPSPSKLLNPLAPNFIPKPNLATSTSASGFGSSTPSALSTTPLNGVLSSNQEPPISDMIVTEPPFVSSPPSMGSTSLEGGMDQTPPPQPPRLNRRQPISLPSTPTATIFIPPSLPPTRKSTLKNLQTSTLSAVPTEILSPLVLHSPVSRSLSSIPGLLRRESIQSPLKVVISAADVEAEAEPSTEKLNTSQVAGPVPAEKPSLDIMKAAALHFARRGWLVKQAFSKWRQRLSDHAKWIEACQRSAHYKEKARTERLSRSVSGSPVRNGRMHRRTPSETRAPLKKRLRERLSGEYRPPANDEELARRFEKNHEDHARRWARGSFLHVLKDFLESTSRPLPDNWSAWLSLNQESDGTAIWLEQKFNVPDSGKWENENVFHIPVSKDHAKLAHSYPGVVIFELTPMTGVTDLLGRKYRVLEDCTRLREIIEAFPADRHYVPSLLCIAWSERDLDSFKDFDDMTRSMVEGGMLTSMHELLINTAALDVEFKLEELLHAVPFDLEGRLVKRVSLDDFFKTWEHPWEETTARWLGHCIVYGEFNWDLYGKLLEGCIRLLTQIIYSVIALLREDAVPGDLSRLQLVKGMDSDTTFDAVLEWLQTLPKTDSIASLMGDIRAHQNLGRDFPTMTFLSQLYALARSIATHVADVHPEAIHFVSRSRLDDASRKVESLKVSFEDEMKACHIAKLKPPKRLASFAETSPSKTSTPRSKKLRLSPSDGSLTDEEMTSPGSPSPPLSISTSAPSEPTHHTLVTPAMLRSLTKEIRAKYGAAGPNALSASVSR
ncbi:SAC3/GANP/Nin1/mts3/eIF-3 p25 family-domain-containing protein [Boletus coccyginus]|nr:SAC3/GANP/Nin1/mts3/eIF-3 p25 family-domain-containing protein [Boletus coccyginus]